MNTQRDNVKAGLFVLAGLIFGLAVVYLLTDLERLLEPTQSAAVYFPIDTGLQGLKEGAAVTLGDEPVGQVTAIEDYATADAPDVIAGKIVHFSLPARYHLHWDAAIELAVPTIGTGTSLNIRSVGRTEPYDPGQSIPDHILEQLRQADVLTATVEPPPGTLVGSPPINSFARSLGIEDEQRVQIKNIIANVDTIIAKLNEDVPQITASAKRTVEKLEPVPDDLTKLMTEVKARVEEVRQVVADAKAITTDARERSEVWFTRIDEVIASAKRSANSAEDSLAGVNKLLKDKDPVLRETVDDVHAIARSVREKTLAQVDDAMTKANKALDNVQRVSDELELLMVGQRPVLERTLANFQLTATQLKLAAIEVRRSPWRLLYQPKDEELEYDNLYDAARSFAMAASALDTATASLRTVVQESDANEEQVGKLVSYLEKLMGRFQETEAKFWEALNRKQTE